MHKESSHDFGKDILPGLIESQGAGVRFPYTGYWMDVGTINPTGRRTWTCFRPARPQTL